MPNKKKTAHAQAVSYYEALNPKTYADTIETVHHALKADLLNRAHDAAISFVSHALHGGLYDLVIDFTSQLFEDKRTESWSDIHFGRGRGLRFKLKFVEALKSYETALEYAHDEHIVESAKFEIASIFVLQTGQHNKKVDTSAGAKKLYGELAQSRNIETQVTSLTALGLLNIKEEHQSKGIAQLNRALKLAQKSRLKRNIRKIYQVLGSTYTHMDNQKALRYLEQADTLRQETYVQYGGQDIEADYFLFEALANAIPSPVMVR